MASIQQSLELADSTASLARQSFSRARHASARAHSPSLRALRRWLPGMALIGLFLGTWELAPRLGWVEPAFLPPFSEVLRSGIALARDGQLWAHVTESLTRSLLGFGLAIVFAVPLGLVIGWFRSVSNAIHPLLELFRCTPALALLPVFILLLGIGESSKIALVLYSCSWPILLNTISAVRNVDPLLVKSARTLGLGTRQLLWKVILPASVPTIFVGFRLAGAISLVALVAAEMLGAKAGLGYLIQYSQYNFQIPQMYAGIVGIALLGLLFTQTLAAIERKFTAWQPPAETGDGG
jgi:NitT/TauT family transport system permease protein